MLPRHRDTFKELAGTLATSFLKYLSGRARKIPLCLLLCAADGAEVSQLTALEKYFRPAKGAAGPWDFLGCHKVLAVSDLFVLLWHRLKHFSGHTAGIPH